MPARPVDLAATPQYAARVRARRRRRSKLAAGLGVLAVVAGFCVWAIGFSPLLSARSVAVLGAHSVPASSISDVADVPLGGPLIRIPLGAIKARVAAIPQVERVRVTRKWPHTVQITVVERRPAVALARDGSYVLLDLSGVAFETAASLPAGVPVVAGVEVDSFGPDRVNAVLETLDSLPASLRRQVVTVSAPTATSVSFTLSGGATVVWGSTDQGARKATVLAALLHLRARQYDVSAPDAPVTMGG